jgi:3-methylcrotonyl-CoA carboxylase alpha subunit
VDTGYDAGSDVSPFYDPRVAKLIARGPSRLHAIRELLCALDDTVIWPVKSNAGFLYRALSHDDFETGKLTTDFIDAHSNELIFKPKPSGAFWREAAKELVSQYEGNWQQGLAGFRLNGGLNVGVRINWEDQSDEVAAPDVFTSDLHSMTAQRNIALVTDCGESFAFSLDHPYGTGHASAHDGDILAPMPGKVIAVDVAEGQAVEAGQRLMVLEAMKMEHALTAPFAGTVAELAARVGSQVQVEALLARVVKAGD